MSNDENETSEAYNHYLELSKPSAEDFQRVFTDEELKKLCLRHKCRVDIWRWNVVDDYRILFTNSGRYQRWSERKRLLMLAKAVNKMKPSILYDEEEIKRTRKEEWNFQLKENILSLNYWERKKLRAILEEQEHEPGPLLHVSDSEEIDEEIQSQCAVNTESMNMNEIYTQSQQKQTQPALEINHIQTQTAPEKASSAALSKQSDEANALLENLDEEDFLIDEDTDDSTETVLAYEQYVESIAAGKPLETLQSEDVAPEIEDIYGVDTMSMTIDSQLSTQTQSTNSSKSPDYDNFKNIIPLTSTQSQSRTSEELEAT